METFYAYLTWEERLSKNSNRRGAWKALDSFCIFLTTTFNGATISIIGEYLLKTAKASMGAGIVVLILGGAIGKKFHNLIGLRLDNGQAIKDLLKFLNIPDKAEDEATAVVSLILLCLVVMARIYVPPAVSEFFYLRAERAYSVSEYFEAEDNLAIAIAVDDSSPCPIFLTGLTSENLKLYDKAKADYRQAIGFPPSACSIKAAINLIRLQNEFNLIAKLEGKYNAQLLLINIALAERTKIALKLNAGLKNKYPLFGQKLDLHLGTALILKNPKNPEALEYLNRAIKAGEESGACALLYAEFDAGSPKKKLAYQCLAAVNRFSSYTDYRIFKEKSLKTLKKLR